jgi:FixJ family two-component response regulator
MEKSNQLSEATKISIVDDDESMRVAIRTLLASFGMTVEEFASAEAFLNSDSGRSSDCLILDVRMPGLSGPELQRRLAAEDKRIPIIFITAYYTEEERTRAMSGGAVALLTNPINEEEFLNALAQSQVKSLETYPVDNKIERDFL